MSLQALAEWLGTSAYTLNKLRKEGVVEEREMLTSEPHGGARLLPKRMVGDALSRAVRVGSSRITLLYLPNSDVASRIPYDYILQRVAKGDKYYYYCPIRRLSKR